MQNNLATLLSENNYFWCISFAKSGGPGKGARIMLLSTECLNRIFKPSFLNSFYLEALINRIVSFIMFAAQICYYFMGII